MLDTPFYDPMKSYEENYAEGPFGAFTETEDVRSQRRGEPQHDFLGHPLYLPFGIPAGPLLNSKFIEAAFKKGFDLAVYKTVRSRKYECHPWPNVLAVHLEGELAADRSEPVVADNNYQEPLSITNSFGVPSMAPDVWQPDMQKAVALAGKGQLVIGSFQGTQDGSGDAEKYIQDYVLAAKMVKETGAQVLEANLSCPNEGKSDLLCFDVERVKQIAEQIKNEIGETPLLLKVAYFQDDAHLRRLVEAVGPVVQGIAAINTIPATIVDKDGKQALPGQGRARSGVCGAVIKWAGVEMVERLAALRGELGMKFVIVGGGGVTTPADYQAYRTAGADAVMSATGAMWNPNLAKEVTEVVK